MSKWSEEAIATATPPVHVTGTTGENVMKYPIHNIKGEVLFEAEIDCGKRAPDSYKKRLAVLWAVSNEKSMAGADLRNANLRNASLCGADLLGASLSNANLCDADLRDTNLSDANLLGASLCDADLLGADLCGADLRNANLHNADLSRADLSNANLYGANLSDANLHWADLLGASLSNANLSNASLSNADLRDANLRDAYLGGASLRGVDLYGASLSNAFLRGSDLSGAILSNCDVKIENIHQKVYQAASQPDALDMHVWHTCNTTHCRAGWVVHLAGKAGYELEEKYGTAVAALIIYRASDPDYHEIPDFYATNEAALADMKRLAQQERM